jgi:probable F420-dependent oxidoreductase
MAKKTKQGLSVGVFQIVPDMEYGDPAVIAKCAEDLGFASYWVPEHTVIPEGSTDPYPGKRPGEPSPDYLFKMPDPFVALARASATTRTIGLGTGVSLIPERNPLLTAKEVASIDHYSGGRMLFGIGGGWNEPECRILGGDFAHRWTQTTESIAVMKKLWTGEYVGHEGRYYNFPPVICLPRPTRRPHPPVLLGSAGSNLVFKRTVEWGDGWLPFTADLQAMASGRAEITRLAKAAGRDPASIDVTLFSPVGFFRTAAEMAELAKTGANGAVIWLQGTSEAALVAELKELAGAVF